MSTKARRAIAHHPAAELFPPMSEDEFAALTEDIRQNGQREPIWLYEGKILDGRNRYSAILRLQEQKVSIEPQFREWDGEGSAVSFVVSLNLHRRHLNESQRAMVAARLSTAERGRPKLNDSIESFNRQTAAETLNVSRESVARAAKVLRHGDAELVAAVKSGEVTVSAASESIEAAKKYPQVAAIIPKSKPEEVVKIAKNLDALPEPIRKEKIQKLVNNDLPTLRELTNRSPVQTEPKNPAKEWAEWVLNARVKLGQLRNASFREGVLLNWTALDKEMVLEAVDLFMDDLSTFRTDVVGGYTNDEYAEEGAEGVVN